jgi:hypothetical protein
MGETMRALQHGGSHGFQYDGALNSGFNACARSLGDPIDRSRPCFRVCLCACAARTSLADEHRGKPGFIANESGSQLRLRLRLPRMASRGNGRGGASNATVHLGYLSSYENMGVASASCLSGCVCGRLILDGHRTGRRVSLEELSPPLEVSRARPEANASSSSWACTLAIEVLPQTSSGLHKVKLTSIATTVGATGGLDVRAMLEGNFNALRRTEAAHELETQGHAAYAYARPVV